MENYIKQKRATPGMVQASDLPIRPMSGTAQIPTSAKANSTLRVSSRELHGYDGPMQFMMSPNNPDQILPTSALASPSNEGMCAVFFTVSLSLSPFFANASTYYCEIKFIWTIMYR